MHQLGCTTAGGHDFFETPHLDWLASEGVRCTHAYATAPVCSPSRASLYTGLHPARLHVTDFIPGARAIYPRALLLAMALLPPTRASLRFLPVTSVKRVLGRAACLLVKPSGAADAVVSVGTVLTSS